MEPIVTDARNKPAPEPEAPTADKVMIGLLEAINANLNRQNELLEGIFLACGGPMQANTNRQLFAVFQQQQQQAIEQAKLKGRIVAAAADAVPNARDGANI